MGKQKPEKREGAIEDLPDILTAIGREALDGIEGTGEQKTAKKVAMVRDAAKEKGITFPQSDGTLKQYIDTVRGNLGWKQKRNRTGKPSDDVGGEPTLNELLAARDLVQKYGAKLAEMLKDIQAFGSVERLEECVAGLAKLTK